MYREMGECECFTFCIFAFSRVVRSMGFGSIEFYLFLRRFWFRQRLFDGFLGFSSILLSCLIIAVLFPDTNFCLSSLGLHYHHPSTLTLLLELVSDPVKTIPHSHTKPILQHLVETLIPTIPTTTTLNPAHQVNKLKTTHRVQVRDLVQVQVSRTNPRRLILLYQVVLSPLA